MGEGTDAGQGKEESTGGIQPQLECVNRPLEHHL